MVGAPAELGAMGVHLINFGSFDDEIDPLEPELLVYELRGDGRLHLVAVEYLTTGDEPEPFAGEVHFHPFAPPFADYALHAWMARQSQRHVRGLQPEFDAPGDLSRRAVTG